MPPTADEIARSHTGAWELLVGSVPGVWLRRDGGALGIVTGVALGGFNGVWGEVHEVEPPAVASLLDAVREARVPHCMQLRPGWPPEVDQIARERGLTRVPGEPIMVLGDDEELADTPKPDGVVLRELRPEEAALHARVAGEGRVTRDGSLYLQVISTQTLRTPGIRCYVGEVQGLCVTTALSVAVGDGVGIFSVATVPEYRRRGYGSAVTARAVKDGLAGGARWAWLSASGAGQPVYEAMGFVTIEQLDLWEPCRSSSWSAGTSSPGGV